MTHPPSFSTPTFKKVTLICLFVLDCGLFRLNISRKRQGNKIWSSKVQISHIHIGQYWQCIAVYMESKFCANFKWEFQIESEKTCKSPLDEYWRKVIAWTWYHFILQKRYSFTALLFEVGQIFTTFTQVQICFCFGVKDIADNFPKSSDNISSFVCFSIS